VVASLTVAASLTAVENLTVAGNLIVAESLTVAESPTAAGSRTVEQDWVTGPARLCRTYSEERRSSEDIWSSRSWPQ